MKRLVPFVIAALIATGPFAQETAVDSDMMTFAPADMKDLNEFRWKKRPIIVFADTEDDPAFIEQMALLHARADELALRDVIVLTDTDPDAASALRLKMRPRGFMLVLVGKDGDLKLRKPFPWNVREITRSIDKMPMRQREIREEKDAARDS